MSHGAIRLRHVIFETIDPAINVAWRPWPAINNQTQRCYLWDGGNHLIWRAKACKPPSKSRPALPRPHVVGLAGI
jgi:hypothetical protein